MERVVAQLRSPETIRDRASILFHWALSDQRSTFRCHLSHLPLVADYVIEVIRTNYPDLQIPFHSRWRHFGSHLDQLELTLSKDSPLAQSQAKIDLATISVLLDAGSGSQWQYRDPSTGKIYTRSEGLAIASFQAFMQGQFSSHPDYPYQVDGLALQTFTESTLASLLQVTPENPVVGLSGRLELLQKLGKILAASPHYFGSDPARPGHLVNYWLTQSQNSHLSAVTVFQTILASLSDIWPGRLTLNGVNLGDVWSHSALPNTGIGSQLIPFHKLSQWLTYSLLEPLQDLGLIITDLNQLTGLAEYRNGGLFLDLGVLEVKDPTQLEIAHPVDAEAIIEWRALTIILLDRLAEIIREKLDMTPEELPLVKVLQGGTWTAGRKIATQWRGGTPPLLIQSDGTVF